MNTNLLKNYNELLSTYNIVEEMFRKKDVDGIVQEYLLPKKDTVSCGYCKESKHNKCNTKHQKGFVIKRLDGNYSLLGNECGKDFGENDEIRKKINELQNKRKLEEKYGNIVKYVDNIESDIKKLSIIRKHMTHWEGLIEKLFDSKSLTEEFIGVIKNSIKQGSIEVKLKGSQIERDEQGNSKVKIQTVHKIGTLNALIALDINKPKKMIEQVYKVNASLRSAEKMVINDEKKINSKKITELNSQLNQIKSIYKSYDEFVSIIEKFNNNDFNMATMIFSNRKSKECFETICEIFSIDMIESVSKTRQTYFDSLREQEKLDNVFESH